MTPSPPTVAQHCGETCTLVEKTVELFGDQMPKESRLALAVEAVKSGKMSQSGAERAYRVPQQTIAHHVPLVHSTDVGRVNEGKPAKLPDSKGRQRPAAKEYPPEFKAEAVRRVAAGERVTDVAKDKEVSRTALWGWCKAAQLPPAPKPSIPATEGTAKPARPRIPPSVQAMHDKERQRVRKRWLPAAQHLLSAYELIRTERDRLGAQYAGKEGRLMMQRRWQTLADAWKEGDVLAEFPALTGKPETAELDGLLLELERMARMTAEWADSLRMYTGCRPCNTRWKGEDPPTT